RRERLEQRERPIERAFLRVRARKQTPRRRIPGILPQRRLELIDGRVIAAAEEQRPCDVAAENRRQRVELEGAPELDERLVLASHVRQVIAVPVVAGRVVRIEVDRLPELVLRADEVPLEEGV